jgi:hypothetical protein
MMIDPRHSPDGIEQFDITDKLEFHLSGIKRDRPTIRALGSPPCVIHKALTYPHGLSHWLRSSRLQKVHTHLSRPIEINLPGYATLSSISFQAETNPNLEAHSSMYP